MASHSLKLAAGVALGLLAAAGTAAAQDSPWGLPPGASEIAPKVDHLYNVIFWITGVTFVGVQGLLLYFCIKYRRRPGGKPGYTHGNNTAEIIWTVSPALVLVFIAFYQFAAWKEAKISPPDPKDPNVVTIQTFAQQFAWNFRYPGPNGQFGDGDDLATQRNFWMPIGSTALMPLRSIDVIHSFFLFQMRVKQDAVPGIRNMVWFKPTGFYVAKVDKTAAPYKQAYAYNWRPKDYQKKWEGDYKWEFVRSEAEFYEKYGAKTVAFDSVAFQYQEGLMRPTMAEAKALAIRDQKVVRGVPWKECDYVIVPFEGTCAELCGLQHFQMNLAMYVLPKVAFDYWMNDTDYSMDEAGSAAEFLWKNWKD
jgi:cytochrome c oxidase subunit 2